MGRDFEKTAGTLIDKASYALLSYLDEEGYPVDLGAAHADVDTGDEPRADASASDGAEIDG